MTSLQDIYDQVSGSGCGVDPAIITAIMSTETDVSKRPLSLGITTAAPSGAGSSGQTVGTNTPGAVAAGQPGAFWGYNDGAEAACAFANYIRSSGLYGYAAGDLDNAQRFFQDLIDNNSNYYVPMAGGESKAAYYAHWQQVARSFGGGAIAAAGQTAGIGLPVLVAAAAAAVLLLLD